MPCRSTEPVARRLAMCLMGAVAVVVPLASPRALAQSTPPAEKPATEPPKPGDARPPDDPLRADPELSDESVENALDEMSKRPAASKPVGPTTRAPAVTVPPAAGQANEPLPGMSSSDFGVPSARRLREGTFLLRREGTILRAPTGDWIFVPRPTATGNVDRPMVLLPSQTLQRLEEAASAGNERPAAVISGQVFAYRGREYILPNMPSSIGPASVGPPAPATEPAAKPPTDNPAVQELIKDLDSRRSAPRALTPNPPRAGGADAASTRSPGASAPASTAPGKSAGASGAALAEGSLITARRGRMIRLAGGELAFTPDSDTDSKTDHPLVLLPCQTLGRMEDVTLWRGDSLALEVSGRVLTYQGRNYLLPTMFIVPAPSEVAPLQ